MDTAVILAAGVGSRLRPLTNAKPKCLVRVCGKPIIDYQIEAYEAVGVNHIVVVIGYRSEMIREHLLHRKTPRITLIENHAYETSNNVASLWLAREEVWGRPFFLSNGDVAVSPEIVRRIAQHPADDCISVDYGSWNEEAMKVAGDPTSLASIAKTIGPNESLGCSTDFYKLSARGSEALFDAVEGMLNRGETNAWTESALQLLMSDGVIEFTASPTNGASWYEIDDPEDLLRAEMAFAPFDRSLSDISAVLLDLDGTVFVGDQAIPGAAEAIQRIRRTGIRICFVSNNSSKSKADYVEKLGNFGIDASEDDITLSSDGAIRYLIAMRASAVFVLGTQSLMHQVQAAGLVVSDDRDVEYVLLGYDTELTYSKLATAALALNSGAALVATHADVNCPTETGLIPDAGSILELLRFSTGKSPVAITGKPEPSAVEHLLRQIPPDRLLIVGDRVHVDMELANRLSAKSVLVLSGATDRAEVETLAKYPSAVLPSIAYLCPSPETAVEACVLDSPFTADARII